MGACLALIGLACVAGVNAGFEAMRRSLPRTSGIVVTSGVRAEVSIGRDRWGRPRIDARDLVDAAYALGFLHGQDRFFQMDLARRYASGTLAELLGPPAASTDFVSRQYEPTRMAAAVLEAAPERHRRWLRAYAQGVNDGLADLGAPPPEYLLLASAPAPWTETDSIMVVLGMWRGLALVGNFERQRAGMLDALPPEVVSFLLPESTRFDALVAGESAYAPAPVPGPDVFDPRGILRGAESKGATPSPPGSNGWVVSGARTAHGGAILANDMHLGIMVPPPWYWAEITWREGESAERIRRAVGVTIPGMPGIVAGSNGAIAWGFTNVTGDVADWVVIDPVEGDGDRYRTPEGDEPFGERIDEVRVRFGRDQTRTVRTTRWGPVRTKTADGRPMALKWTGTQAECIDLRLLDMLECVTLEQGLDIVSEWGGPPQNVMVASADGRIGWTIAGQFPVRRGFDGRVPSSWAAPGVGWDGFAPPAAKARTVDPVPGFIATANARTVGGEAASMYGDNFSPPFRQARIADVLEAMGAPIDERAMVTLQQDARVAVFDFWRDLLIEAAGDDPALAEAARIARAWNGSAHTGEAGLPLISAFRGRVEAAVVDRVLAAKGAAFSGWYNDEEPLRRVVESRPAHWLPPREESWAAMFRRCATEAWEAVSDLDSGTWVTVTHPLSDAAGGALRRLDMPRERATGHEWAVRVLAGSFGASERFAVSPGREESGLCELPVGPSGHPMSPWYRSTHRGWVRGDAPLPVRVEPDRGAFTLHPR